MQVHSNTLKRLMSHFIDYNNSNIMYGTHTNLCSLNRIEFNPL